MIGTGKHTFGYYLNMDNHGQKYRLVITRDRLNLSPLQPFKFLKLTFSAIYEYKSRAVALKKHTIVSS